MKHLVQTIFSLVLLMTGIQQAKGSHIVGADIGYKHITGNTYKVTFRMYRDCRGTPIQSVDFKVYCDDGSNAVVLNPTRKSIKDISVVCSKDTLPCNPPNTTTGNGQEEHLYEIQINFNDAPYKGIKDNCCKVLFSVSVCCRAGAITNLTPGNFYLESMLDLCMAGTKGNTSAEFGNLPLSSVCCNQPFVYNCGVKETSDNDSLGYELADALNNYNSSEAYTGSFNKSIPMTPYCPPNPGVINCRPLPGAKPPRGFYFDNLNGNVVFTPTKCDEAGVVVFKVTEWRRDSSNQWQLVGYVKRETTWFVQTCNSNNPPYYTGTSNYSVCAGEKICFNIASKDDPYLPVQTKPDTVTMSWDSGIAGGTFAILDRNAREKEAQFCWQTKVEDARSNPYSFTVTLNDDFCPTPGLASKTYYVNVKPRAQASIQYSKGLSGKLIFESMPVLFPGYDPANFRYKFTIRDSANGGIPLYQDVVRKDSFTFTQAGRYIIEHEINNPPYNCPTLFYDTITITRQHIMSVPQCITGMVNVYPNPSKGTVYLSGPEVDFSGYTLKVVTTDGRLMTQMVMKGNTIDCSALAPGLYNLVVEKEGFRYTGSVLIQ